MSLLSVVITAFNEGDEVRNTIASVRANIEMAHEVIVVDDGSTDGCCNGLDDDIRVVRRAARQGVACARNAGCEIATGNVLAFLDAHQRLSPNCLDYCAAVALEAGAIVWPEVRDFGPAAWTGYGADLALGKKDGTFTGKWRCKRPVQEISPISTLIAPGYVMPRQVCQRVKWIGGLRGWGGSEAAVAIKAFFLGVRLLHLRGPVAWHLFRKKFHYETSWLGCWRNHALVARICFEERTWHDHWRTSGFVTRLPETVRQELDGPEVLAEQERFQSAKLRKDSELWTDLLRTDLPAELNDRDGRRRPTMLQKTGSLSEQQSASEAELV